MNDSTDRPERPDQPERAVTTTVVSQVNLTAIVETLQEHGPLSRRELGRRTGLSPATVNRLTTHLLREGTVVLAGVEPSEGGRPSHLLRFAGETRVVAALHVKREGVTGILRDLTGATVHRRAVDVDTDADPRAAARARLDVCLDLAAELLADAERHGKPCLGVGVSVPGFVRLPAGHVLQAAELEWEDLPLGELLAERTGLPHFVENDANAIAYAEWASGAGVGSDNLVAIELGTGIGAGIITEGRPHRGSRWVAGEIGYLLTGRSSLSVTFTDVGDLESRLGARALERAAARHGWRPEDGPVAAWLVRRTAAGEPAVAALGAELFDLVAMAAAALASVLDPDVVILCGALSTEPDHSCAQVTARLTDRIPRPPAVVTGQLGPDAPLVGAAELITRQVQGFTYVQR